MVQDCKETVSYWLEYRGLVVYPTIIPYVQKNANQKYSTTVIGGGQAASVKTDTRMDDSKWLHEDRHPLSPEL